MKEKIYTDDYSDLIAAGFAMWATEEGIDLEKYNKRSEPNPMDDFSEFLNNLWSQDVKHIYSRAQSFQQAKLP